MQEPTKTIYKALPDIAHMKEGTVFERLCRKTSGPEYCKLPDENELKDGGEIRLQSRRLKHRHHTLFGKAVKLVSCYYSMVYYFDIDAPECVYKSSRDSMIVMRRSDRPGRMVVRQHHRGRFMSYSRLCDEAGMNECLFDSTFAYKRRIDNSQLGIEAYHIEHFF